MDAADKEEDDEVQPWDTRNRRREKESQNHTEECRERIEKALIEEGGIKGKRMTEGNQRYEEHKTKKGRREQTTNGKEEEQHKQEDMKDGEEEERHNQKGTKRGPDDAGTAATSSDNQQEKQDEEEQ